MRIYILSILLLLLLPVVSHASERTAPRLIKVAIDAEYPPYEFVGKDGQVKGFIPDLLRDIASANKLRVEFLPMSWPEAIQGLEQGRVDLINMIHTPERAERYEFSQPHSGIAQAIFRNKREAHIGDMGAIRGEVVILQTGDIATEKLAERDDFSRLMVTNKQQGFLKLNAGKAAVFFTAEQPGLLFVQQHGLSNIELAKVGLWPQDYCFTAKKGNTALISQLNTALAKLKQSGHYDEIYQRWMIQPPGWVVRFGQPILISTLILLALIALWVRRTRRHNQRLQGALALLEKSESRYRKLYASSQRTSDIFQMLATTTPAQQVYDAICRMYEAANPDIRASILKLQGDQLCHCSAPGLPEAYTAAIDGVSIGVCAGPCGTAAFLGQEIICENIATDPRWTDYKELALQHQLQACWSVPVTCHDGKVLGTFAMYFEQPASPTEALLQEIRAAAGLVCIVMEKELRESSVKKLSQAIEQSGESMLITDREGIIEYTNPAFTSITGYSHDEALGKKARIFKRSNHQDERLYESMWETISRGSVWQHKTTDKYKHGSLYPVMLTISPIINDEGKITHFVAIQADLSSLESLEKQFHQAQKMEAIGTLVGGIAHDFNNILAGMDGNIYLARQQLRGQSSVSKKLSNLEQLSVRAGTMIEQLLTFARKGIVNMEVMPLTPLISESIQFLRRTLPEDIRLNVHLCAGELHIRGDATQLHQVLINLVNNARDAVEHADAPSITIRLEVRLSDELLGSDQHPAQTGPHAHLSIEDNGCGIPASQTAQLFEPFYTTKPAGKGTGLGLAMVYGAINTHHGFVDVESCEGQGSSFHVYLPLLEAADVVFEPAQAPPPSAGHGETILFADDEDVVRETTAEVLESMGYRVIQAEHGKQALSLFEEHQQDIDLALLDVVMPYCGGSQLAAQLREVRPDLPVIFLTGYDKERVLLNDDQIHNSEVLSKPVLFDHLSRNIQLLLK